MTEEATEAYKYTENTDQFHTTRLLNLAAKSST